MTRVTAPNVTSACAPFHLNLRTDLDLPSCGAAYVSAACRMSVYCNPCGARIERMTAAATARPLRVR
jgi:hypothetical protein